MNAGRTTTSPESRPCAGSFACAQCSDCHLVTHYGHARVTGREARAFAHLRAVTDMTDDRAERHIDDAMCLWERRSSRDWALDLSLLTDAGVQLALVRDPASRRAAAELGLLDAKY